MTQNISEVFLPSNLHAIKNLKLLSLLSGFLTIILSALLAYFNLIDLYIALACVSGSALICFHLLRKPGKILTLPQKIAGLIVSTLICGFASGHVINSSFKDLYSLPLFCLVVSIFLLSVKLPHRHHFSHLFAFAGVMISSFFFFLDVYIFFSEKLTLSSFYPEFSISLLLLLFSQTILFCKPDRGFLGMMTINTTSSKVALRFIFYFICIGPLLSLLVLLGEYGQIYSQETILPLLVILLTGTSIIMTWLNAKFLYKLELEKYLITEILRVNNVHLETSSDDLKTQIAKLELENKEITDKFDHRNRLKDIISARG